MLKKFHDKSKIPGVLHVKKILQDLQVFQISGNTATVDCLVSNQIINTKLTAICTLAVKNF